MQNGKFLVVDIDDMGIVSVAKKWICFYLRGNEVQATLKVQYLGSREVVNGIYVEC